jgi:predicted GNAT family acetyltransferase
MFSPSWTAVSTIPQAPMKTAPRSYCGAAVSALPTLDPDVTDNTDEHRYEIRVDGQLVGYAVYQRSGDRVAFVHTVVNPDFSGRGIGSRLVAAALDDVRRRREQAVAQCSFVVRYIERHPEYRDLLTAPGGAGA